MGMEEIRCVILLNEVDKINNFVIAAGKVSSDIDLIRGRYVIDAKSLMGIYSLSLDKPIEMVVRDDIDGVGVQTFLETIKNAGIIVE